MEKKIAIVTGGTRGMGQAISIGLARENNIVFALYRSDEKSAQETLEKMRNYSLESDILQCDVSNRSSTERAVREIGDKSVSYTHLRFHCLRYLFHKSIPPFCSFCFLIFFYELL